ncbi:MAG: hypothetical protein ACRENP_16600 [Longimicrobiales bacterium]
MRTTVTPLVLLAAAACWACESSAGPDERPIPPPGPHFSITPLPLDVLARITVIGFNNKVFPTPHTYWMLCDDFVFLQSNRPCRQERLAVRAPRAGTVLNATPVADGFIRLEGPPGLVWTFGHVTPATGLTRGTRVAAGQVVATMFQTNGIDFGLINHRVQHHHITPARYPLEWLHGENPIAQFPEPIRAQLLTRVNSLSDPLGRLAFDVAGTASGGWFVEGTPKTNVSLQLGNEWRQLWLGRYVEREETRVASFGQRWQGMQNYLLAVDPAAPAWEQITPATGVVSMKLWNMDRQALPNYNFPGGTLLIQLLDATRLRMEWFNTHNSVSAFTSAAVIYER